MLFVASAVTAAALLIALQRSDGVYEATCDAGASCGVSTREPVGDSAPASDTDTARATKPVPERDGVPPAAPREAAPVDAAALRDEADRLIAEGKVLEGVDVFRRAVRANPTAENHGDLGMLLYKFTALDEAATHLSAAAELDPGNADRWIALANVFYRKVDLGKAWAAEKRAREAEPGLELGRDDAGMRIRKGDKAPRQP